MPEQGPVLLSLLADQGCQVTALIGRDDADGPPDEPTAWTRFHCAGRCGGGLVLLLMADGGALPGAYRAAV
jgi:hypothetical protein